MEGSSEDCAPGPVPSAVGTRGWWLAVSAAMVALTAHLAAILVYLTVPAPAAPTVRAVADAWIVPYFAQDWRLFAPLPDAHDYGAYARAHRRAGDGPAATPWVDLLDPLVAAVQANRLAGEGVSLEVVHKATLLTVHAAGLRAIFPDSRAALAAQWSDPARQPASLVVLEAVASSVLSARYPEANFESVQVMVTARRVRPAGAATNADDAVAIAFEPVPLQRVAPWPR